MIDSVLWFLMYGVFGFVLPQVVVRAFLVRRERRRLQRVWEDNARRVREDCVGVVRSRDLREFQKGCAMREEELRTLRRVEAELKRMEGDS